MGVGVKQGSLEWHYQITHRNILDKEFQEIVSQWEKTLQNHIINESIRSIIDLFVIYKKLDDQIVDHYFLYWDPTPLLFDGTYNSDEESYEQSEERDPYQHIAYDPDKDENPQMEVPEDGYVNPHEALFTSLKNGLTKTVIEGKSNGTELTVDAEFFDEEYEIDLSGEDVSGYNKAPEYFHIIHAWQQWLLDAFYPMNEQVMQEVQNILQSKKKTIITLLQWVARSLQEHIDGYNRSQEAAFVQWVARPVFRDKKKTVWIPAESFRWWGEKVTYKWHNIRVNDGSYIGKWEKDPQASTITANQRGLLEKEVMKYKTLTDAEKTATKRVMQYMTKWEASTLIERFLKANKGAAYKTRDELARDRNRASGDMEDLPF